MAGQLPSAQDLLAIFDRQNPDGTYFYKDHEVRDFVPLLVMLLSNTESVAPMPPAISALMDEFALKIGLAEDATPEQVQAAIDGYYAKNPIPPQMLEDFQAFVHQVTAEDEQESSNGA